MPIYQKTRRIFNEKTRKIGFCAAVAAILTIGSVSLAFAGEWRFDEWQGKWHYDNGGGNYASNGWHWIDGNMDGILTVLWGV